MTAAWGKCCTQFFMHNGKRSEGLGGMGPRNRLSQEQDRRSLTLKALINTLGQQADREPMVSLPLKFG